VSEILRCRGHWRKHSLAFTLPVIDDMTTMKAVVFKGKDRIAIEQVPKPRPKTGEAVIRITTTTICGTDVHIVRGE
jgi:hypothetical protein